MDIFIEFIIELVLELLGDSVKRNKNSIKRNRILAFCIILILILIEVIFIVLEIGLLKINIVLGIVVILLNILTIVYLVFKYKESSKKLEMQKKEDEEVMKKHMNRLYKQNKYEE